MVVRYFQRFFCARSREKPDLAKQFLTHERNSFRSLQIDHAGGYLDFRPRIRLAGDGIPKAAGTAQQSMKKSATRRMSNIFRRRFRFLATLTHFPGLLEK
jgi:hypothetical protein